MFRNAQPREFRVMVYSKRPDDLEFVAAVPLATLTDVLGRKAQTIKDNMEGELCDLNILEDVEKASFYFYLCWRFRRTESRFLQLLPEAIVLQIVDEMVRLNGATRHYYIGLKTADLFNIILGRILFFFGF
jgi:hypothetical protein